MRDDLCVFILSHGRPDRVPTIRTLRNYGYSGDWYLVIDHEEEREDYEAEHGEERVLYFDKEEVIPEIDRGDNFDHRNCNVYARNKVFDFAEELGYDYFFVLDDDYSFFQWRFNGEYDYDPRTPSEFGLDRYMNAAVEFLEEAGLDTLCMSQGGDFIGGAEASFAQAVQTKRKAMNTFLFKTDRPVRFSGTLNEDVNTYVREQQLGQLFLTTNVASVEQEQTQQEEGGLTDIYLAQGTYVKSFYSILYSPSSVSLGMLKGRSAERIHHRVDWRACVPKILPETAKKTADSASLNHRLPNPSPPGEGVWLNQPPDMAAR